MAEDTQIASEFSFSGDELQARIILSPWFASMRKTLDEAYKNINPLIKEEQVNFLKRFVTTMDPLKSAIDEFNLPHCEIIVDPRGNRGIPTFGDKTTHSGLYMAGPLEEVDYLKESCRTKGTSLYSVGVYVELDKEKYKKQLIELLRWLGEAREIAYVRRRSRVR